MLPGVPPPSVPPLVLIQGDEELLVSRAVRETLVAARAADPELEVVDRAAGELTESDVVDLGASSLFGGLRAVVVRAAQELTDELRDALIAYVSRPMSDVMLVVVHNGAVRNRKIVDAMKAAGARTITVPKITRPRERHDFVVAEVRRAGGKIADAAVTALLDAVGSDLREIAAVCEQLVADTDGPLDEAAVHRFHRGRAEASGFAVADAAVAGDLAGALTLLRQALEAGTAAVLISSAVTGGLRDLARVAGAGGGSKYDLARALGMPDWKVERAQRSARAWSDEGLSRALRAAATADAGVKGGAADSAYALETLVRAVVEARGRHSRAGAGAR
ncbi:DNA polymerase III subunit delta [Frankia sp. CNm7]|uniref:DNA-directed DNA polymerase n=1 Tax=Frankia nepalensis TaxID=1836974 RepID=A0A937UUV2_9ACTN|nr:DNA polymerase III subunit delta [Frankia nepalensis]MBL7500132.1 DNA polymerase III subunit delta [Frankia nepalensis]MBL7511164.1 DNA polymerase III subunit delta [Frankia nepalensis]MBL7517835.1 DNA polymerase III subunit delta [Frankia nepalensis]MBL7631576.1 DNA polymerase III subunit delta [Frankia nepalensis]